MEVVSPSSTLMTSTTSRDFNLSTVFHIYHVGQEKRPRNYSIHTIKDGNTTILAPAKAPKSDKSSKPRKSSIIPAPQSTQSLEHSEKSPVQNTCGDKSLADTSTSSINATESGAPTQIQLVPLKGVRKAKLLDNPKHDPRSETAPYFLHLPRVALKEPPYTLRRAGHKRAPVVCLMRRHSLWQGWKLEFGDVLSQPGVIDGRGVVNVKYGTKNGKFEGEDGFLTGFKVTKRRWWGESGKAYWQEQKANGFEDNAHAGELRVKPEEVVNLKWTSPFSLRTRDHSFEWRGYKFLWKGTTQVEQTRKAAKWFVWCSHLKLVVQLPRKDSEVAPGIRPPPDELLLARYSCTMGNRKAGRLEVFQENIDTFLEEHIFIGQVNMEEEKTNASAISEAFSAGGTTEGVNSQAKTHQRLRDVIFSTALCMLINERDKRRFLLELLQEIGENAGG